MNPASRLVGGRARLVSRNSLPMNLHKNTTQYCNTKKLAGQPIFRERKE